MYDYCSAPAALFNPIPAQAPPADLLVQEALEPPHALLRGANTDKGQSIREANDLGSEALAMSYRQRHVIAPLLDAIRELLKIFSEEMDPSGCRHSSPAVYLETAQWARILQEFD